MAENGGAKRTAVKTYVPAYQKETWQAAADELDMTQSEFVRTMVQAGRRDFDLDPVEDRSGDATPSGSDLEDRVIEVLRSGSHSWDELVSALTADFEERLEDTLDELQTENRVQYSGRRGGYIMAENDE